MVHRPTGGLWQNLLPWLTDGHNLYVNMAFSLVSLPLLIRMPVLLDKAPPLSPYLTLTTSLSLHLQIWCIRD